MAITNRTVDIITLNCQGLRNLAHRDTLFSWLNCCKVDILCLQETHSISELEFTSWVADATAGGLNKIGYKCISSPGTSCSCGVAILYHPEFELVNCSRDQGT